MTCSYPFSHPKPRLAFRKVLGRGPTLLRFAAIALATTSGPSLLALKAGARGGFALASGVAMDEITGRWAVALRRTVNQTCCLGGDTENVTLGAEAGPFGVSEGAMSVRGREADFASLRHFTQFFCRYARGGVQ